MDKDGTLRLMLRTETADGMIGEMTMAVPRGDPRYAGFVAHLGGMKPGDAKPIPPFRSRRSIRSRSDRPRVSTLALRS